MPLNNPRTTEEVKEDIKTYLETMENGNKVIENVCKAARAVLRRKYIVIQGNLRKQEKSKKKEKKERKSNLIPKKI